MVRIFETTDSFIKYLSELYAPFYAMNDKAHQIGHVIEVTREALNINEKLYLRLDEYMLVAVGMVHDLFNNDRDNHHTLAAEYVLKNPIEWLCQFSHEDRVEMSQAVAEHRASYRGKYSGELSATLSAADRGKPDVERTVKRAFKYALNCNVGFRDIALAQTQEHMVDKFGTKGYARYPQLYTEMYEAELQSLQTVMDVITLDEIAEICKNIN